MKHVDTEIASLAARQFHRISVRQLADLGLTETAVSHRVRRGRLIRVEDGVYSVAPLLDGDDWGTWMAAALTAPNTFLSRSSAAVARGWWSLPRQVETVTRPGSGGPRRYGGVLVFRSTTLAGDCTTLRGIPITSPERTLLDLATFASDRALARAVRQALRLEQTTLATLGDALGRYRGRRGCARLGMAVGRYSGLPVERARSGAEIRAMEILRDQGRPLPMLNRRIAGEEADLSWSRSRLIIEIDGGPFHLDRGEDARKEGIWASAGWSVRRLPSGDVYERPNRLLALAPA